MWKHFGFSQIFGDFLKFDHFLNFYQKYRMFKKQFQLRVEFYNSKIKPQIICSAHWIFDLEIYCSWNNIIDYKKGFQKGILIIEIRNNIEVDRPERGRWLFRKIYKFFGGNYCNASNSKINQYEASSSKRK